MIAAAAVFLLAALVIGGANPLDKAITWWRMSNPDRLVAEVRDERDLDGNVAAFDAMGATR